MTRFQTVLLALVTVVLYLGGLDYALQDVKGTVYDLNHKSANAIEVNK